MKKNLVFKLAILISGLSVVSSVIVFFMHHGPYIQVLSVVPLSFAPFLLEKIFKFRFPKQLLFFYDFFLFASIILGTGFNFYSLPLWDKYLHVFAGYVMGEIGFSIFLSKSSNDILYDQRNVVALFCLSFAAFLGVLWEIYEYTGDLLFNLNMQRYQTSNGVPYIGKIALDDTMGDLIADLLGALVFTLFILYQMKRNDMKFDNWRFRKVR